MKAAILQNGEISVGEAPDPTPGKGQVLVKTLNCALCASDLHVLNHGEQMVRDSKEYGGIYNMDLTQPVVMGHEYCAEILDYGPGSKRPLPVGSRVTSLPVLFDENGYEVIGLSNCAHGGFGEYMLLSEDLVREVPKALPHTLASLIEPFAVGVYYANVARMIKGDVALVIGCGAIGLAVVAALNAMDCHPIIASDFSELRRALALQMGADIVIDPSKESPFAAHSGTGNKPPNVIFECVGAPGLLDQIFKKAVWRSRIFVAGVCAKTDHICSPAAHTKGLQVLFGGGENAEDIDTAIRLLDEGKVDLTPWLAKEIGLSQVGECLRAMADPASGVRTVVDPSKI